MNWEAHATQYRIKSKRGDIFIEAREQRDGRMLWAVRHFGAVLDWNGDWEVEPIPSSRDDEYLKRTRLPSKDAALERLRNFVGDVQT